MITMMMTADEDGEMQNRHNPSNIQCIASCKCLPDSNFCKFYGICNLQIIGFIILFNALGGWQPRAQASSYIIFSSITSMHSIPGICGGLKIVSLENNQLHLVIIYLMDLQLTPLFLPLCRPIYSLRSSEGPRTKSSTKQQKEKMLHFPQHKLLPEESNIASSMFHKIILFADKLILRGKQRLFSK